MLKSIILKQPERIREISFVSGKLIFIPAGLTIKELKKELDVKTIPTIENKTEREQCHAFTVSTMVDKPKTKSLSELLMCGGR